MVVLHWTALREIDFCLLISIIISWFTTGSCLDLDRHQGKDYHNFLEGLVPI